MKDAYSFDRDAAGLEERYQAHVAAYDRIMDRTGLRWYRVESDVGMMGGLGAHEYMAPCPAGENEVALAPGYAANVEVASADAVPVELPDDLSAPEQVVTPGLTRVAEVASQLGLPEGAFLKAFPVITAGADSRMVLVLVRGDHRVNEIKLANALGAPHRPARAEEVESALGPPGFLGPVGLNGRVEILLDDAVADGCYVTGANAPDTHLRGVRPGRDFQFARADVRTVQAGDTVAGHAITIEPAIEVGNIFKLGTRYSEPLNATYLDEAGKDLPIWMGSYGIGPARIVAAAVEQYADEHGICWPRALAPFAVHLVSVAKADTPERAAAEELYANLIAAGIEVLYDDRNTGTGEKFAEAELLGCPLRITLGARSVKSGAAEVQIRRGQAEAPGLPLDHDVQALAQTLDDLWRSLP
jgi:prolyl-tRNA synthetase